jgi:uncharacterized protein DUF4387
MLRCPGFSDHPGPVLKPSSEGLKATECSDGSDGSRDGGPAGTSFGLHRGAVHCPASSVHVYICPNARAIKATIPRPKAQGTFGDADLHGGQQYAPLLDLEI